MSKVVENAGKGIKDFKAMNGQTINRATGLDTSSMEKGAFMDTLNTKSMRGGPENLSHSIKGASANQRGTS